MCYVRIIRQLRDLSLASAVILSRMWRFRIFEITVTVHSHQCCSWTQQEVVL